MSTKGVSELSVVALAGLVAGCTNGWGNLFIRAESICSNRYQLRGASDRAAFIKTCTHVVARALEPCTEYEFSSYEAQGCAEKRADAALTESNDPVVKAAVQPKQAEPTAAPANPTAGKALPGDDPGDASDGLPPDGQVLRDIQPALVRGARALGARVRDVKIVKKGIDQYERDQCNVSVTARYAGLRFIYQVVYERAQGFWRLRGVSEGGYLPGADGQASVKTGPKRRNQQDEGKDDE